MYVSLPYEPEPTKASCLCQLSRQNLPYEQKFFFFLSIDFMAVEFAQKLGLVSTTTSTFSRILCLFCLFLCFGFLVLTSLNQVGRIFMQIYIPLPMRYTTVIRLPLSCFLRRSLLQSSLPARSIPGTIPMPSYGSAPSLPKKGLCWSFVLLRPWICFCSDLSRWLWWWTYKVWLVFYSSCRDLNLSRQAPSGLCRGMIFCTSP